MSRTIDLSSRGWGNDYSFTPISPDGIEGKLCGWSKIRPQKGDYFILKNGSGTTRYQAVEVRFPGDPIDMFFADVVFSPRTEESE